MTTTRARRCRICRGAIKGSGKGRPRVFCTVCAPPGVKHPTGVSRPFPGNREQADQARKRRAARAAAVRVVAGRHPDELAEALAAELEKRGVR